ncbi:MAG: hypothetical protein LCH95_00335 [Proteobacteria bacterium]|nr:hypothetical protein [Pseudomonadota bacterium]
METLKLVETQDLSAIEAVEAAQEKRRATVAAAAAAALRRAGWLRAGLGAGAAATGLGLGVLLACWGVSLLRERPGISPEAVQAAEARAVAAEQAAAEARAIVDKFQALPPPPTTAATPGSPPARSVVDFTIFRHNRSDTLAVTTGWKYEALTDPAPSSQWCYVQVRGTGLAMDIAVDGQALTFNAEQARRANVTAADVQRSLPLCEWFRGANPNIRDGQAAAR